MTALSAAKFARRTVEVTGSRTESRAIELRVLSLFFIATVTLRFLTVSGPFGDDHFALWTAAALLQGDLPFRDFFEIGAPLQGLISALAQVVFGRRFLGELALGIGLEAAGLTIALLLAWRASRSLPIALMLMLAAVFLYAGAKLYTYPKTVIYPLGIWLCWRYIERPVLLRAVTLAVGLGTIFLFRHDHGLYIGIGAALAVIVAHWGQGSRAVVLGLARCGAMTVLWLAPFLAWVQVSEGLLEYFRTRVELSRSFGLGADRPNPWFSVGTGEPLLALRLAPAPPASLSIVWTPETSQEARRELERQYGLTEQPSATADRWWGYELADFAESNVTALATDRNVESISGVEPASWRWAYRAQEPPPAGRSVVVRWTLESLHQLSALDRQYHLDFRGIVAGDYSGLERRYVLLDDSEENIGALGSDPHVECIVGPAGRAAPGSDLSREPPPVGAPIGVQWRAGVGDESRMELEAHYTLANRRADRDARERWGTYDVVNFSDDNVTALATDPHVELTDRTSELLVPRTYRVLAPPTDAEVAVQWASGVDDQQRAEMEAQYHLTQGYRARDDPSGRWWRYRVTDPSDDNVTALVADPHVESTGALREILLPLTRLVLEPRWPGVPVAVRWASGVNERRRGELERQYSLVRRRRGPDDPPVSWNVYLLTDSSDANATALATSPQVREFNGIEPGAAPGVFRVKDPPPLGVPLSVRWATGIDRLHRAALEERYQLANAVPRDDDLTGRAWSYILVDYSEANAMALTTDPLVESTDGLTSTVTTRTYQVQRRPSALVEVRWSEQVSADRRADLEGRYQLLNSVDRHLEAGAKWDYVLADADPAKIRALARDPAVASISGLDGDTLRPDGESWLVGLQRDHSLLRATLTSALFQPRNAEPWLYWLFVLLPGVVVATLVLERGMRTRVTGPVMTHEVPKMVAAALIVSVAEWGLLRRSAAVVDLVGPVTVLGAWLMSRVLRAPAASAGSLGDDPQRPVRARTHWATLAWRCQRAGVVAALLWTTWAAVEFADLPTTAERSGFFDGPRVSWERGIKRFQYYATTPPIDAYAPAEVRGQRALFRYIWECTHPDDRIWDLNTIYPLPYYTDRRPVQHVYWAWAYRAEPEHQRQTLDWLASQSVPIVIEVDSRRWMQELEAYDLLYEYASAVYVEVASEKLDENSEGRRIRVFVDHRREATGWYEPLDLPCFR